MIGKIIGSFGLGPEVEMRTADDLRPARALVHGAVHAPATIPSAAKGTACVAFYYRGSYRRASRLKGFQQELLRDALCYAPDLTLQIGDVTVALAPTRNDDFGPDTHEALASGDLEGYIGVEQTIPNGASVRAAGRLRRRGEGWTLDLEALHYDPPPKKTQRAKKTQKKRRR